jgi:hypothetical protein
MLRIATALGIALAGLLSVSARAAVLTTAAVYSTNDLTRCRILNLGSKPLPVSIWVMDAGSGAVAASFDATVEPMHSMAGHYVGTNPYFCRFEFPGRKSAVRATLEQRVDNEISTTLEAR